jgi:superfamily II DNA/RNA helicase
MHTAAGSLKVPDLWQQSALRLLRAGHDVVVSAPTGAGKTFVFELLINDGLTGNAVYTVPTRALANDKRAEWLRMGWQVGICTGDRTDNLDATVVVATMETQKPRLLAGEGPALLVVDEYQMLADAHRGINYEWSIAGAPRHTQLLLFSGSVANPEHVVEWLRRLGRRAELVRHQQRPVPLEEVHVEALPDNIPSSVVGLWPRTIARALRAGLAPLLAFAPRRKAAEELAADLARMLPEEDPLVLTPEQKALAGAQLRRLLKNRVAFHHSGLSYAQRAGLIEPLAKAGQLKVVVATMGLAAGINFSMRSVLVTDRQYRSGDHTHEVRPDELLQMFGRAGRRGMDKRGSIIVVPGKPRLSEARPLRLRRSRHIDWPSLLRVMQTAIQSGSNPLNAARQMTSRLFSQQRIPLGLEQFMQRNGELAAAPPRQRSFQQVKELCNPDGIWERARTPRKARLGDCLLCRDGQWQPALMVADTLAAIPFGSLCRLNSHNGTPAAFGRLLPAARLGRDAAEGELVLNRALLRLLRAHPHTAKRRWQRHQWTLDRLEQDVIPLLPKIANGGSFAGWRERADTLLAQLDFHGAHTYAHFDASGRPLLQPPLRTTSHEIHWGSELLSSSVVNTSTAAGIWFELGLIDRHGAPTRRGILFSFFNYGEGLAIAAALEDASYPIEDIIIDLANLRAGHRFSFIENSSSRMTAACRSCYGMATFTGYLLRGLPPTYGEGAAELLAASSHHAAYRHPDSDLRQGDVQRAELEWRSLIRHIAAAPHLNWQRWLDLRAAARTRSAAFPASGESDSYPPLTQRQRQRHKSFLDFPDA